MIFLVSFLKKITFIPNDKYPITIDTYNCQSYWKEYISLSVCVSIHIPPIIGARQIIGIIINPHKFHLVTDINKINNDVKTNAVPGNTNPGKNLISSASNIKPITDNMIKSITMYLAKLLLIISPHNYDVISL